MQLKKIIFTLPKRQNLLFRKMQNVITTLKLDNFSRKSFVHELKKELPIEIFFVVALVTVKTSTKRKTQPKSNFPNKQSKHSSIFQKK